MKFSNKQVLILVGIAAAGLFYARSAVADVGKAVNPLNQDNAIYQGSNGVVQKITGRSLDKYGRPLTLGAWLAGG